MKRRLLCALCVALGTGCAGGATRAAVAPDTERTPSATNGSANGSGPAPSASPPPPAPAAVPPAPASCAEFGAAPQPSCVATGSSWERLAAALEQNEPVPRDVALACIEAEHAALAPSLRALRAELAPLECGDAIVAPLLETARALSPEDESTLLGVMLAAQLQRLLRAPPTLTPPFDKPRFQSFFEQELKPWIVSQALAIGELSQRAAQLKGYGRAIAAIEAGIADLSFVRAARQVALPEELARDAELRDVYYAALDEALEPRKQRGRDAALVGLRAFSELGVLADARVTRARAALSELYGGSRVHALDGLLVPELRTPAPTTLEQRLAATLPSYYAGRFLASNPGWTERAQLAAFATRGVPALVRVQLDQGKLSTDAGPLYAALELRRGMLYFSGAAFAHAEALAATRAAEPDAALVHAVARALAHAPQDIAASMLAGARLPGPLGPVDALEALAARRGPRQGEALFDLAFVRSLTPPQQNPAFWLEISQTFTRAAPLLADARAAARARELAAAARNTAGALKP